MNIIERGVINAALESSTRLARLAVRATRQYNDLSKNEEMALAAFTASYILRDRAALGAKLEREPGYCISQHIPPVPQVVVLGKLYENIAGAAHAFGKNVPLEATEFTYDQLISLANQLSMADFRMAETDPDGFNKYIEHKVHSWKTQNTRRNQNR